jgi:hypothetical protein
LFIISIYSDTTVFEVNPLQHDELFRKEVERFEQARILKKIAEIQKKKGIMNLKQYKNFHSLLKDEDLPGMKFGIEKKVNKDTFENYDKLEKTKNTTAITRQCKIII